MTIALSTVELPFDSLGELGLPQEQLSALETQLRPLEAAIPRNLLGIFEIRLEKEGDVFVPTGLRIQPDPTIHAMNTLLSAAKEKTISASHEFRLSRLYAGDDFNAIMEHAQTASNDDMPRSGRPWAMRAGYGADKTYLREGVDYEDTYTLPQALKITLLPPEEIALLRKIISQIPENVRGAFACDLARDAQGVLRVHAVGVDPNITAHVCSETVLRPVVERITGPQTEPHPLGERFTRLPAPHTGTTFMRRDALERLGATLPDPGAQIAV